MISYFYNRNVVTQRLADVVGTSREEWATNLASLSCHIQQNSTEDQQLASAGFYNLFTLWCQKDTDIMVGDRVLYNSETYTVKGVKSLDVGVGSDNEHLEIALVVGR